MTDIRRMTDRARQVLSLAEQEARRLHSPTVEPEHILLGLVLEGDGLAAHALKHLGVTKERILQLFPIATSTLNEIGDVLPYSEATNRVLVQTQLEANLLKHHYSGTE